MTSKVDHNDWRIVGMGHNDYNSTVSSITTTRMSMLLFHTWAWHIKRDISFKKSLSKK